MTFVKVLINFLRLITNTALLIKVYAKMQAKMVNNNGQLTLSKVRILNKFCDCLVFCNFINFILERTIKAFPGHQPELNFQDAVMTYESEQRLAYLDPRIRLFPLNLKTLLPKQP